MAASPALDSGKMMRRASPAERFADALAAEVFARILAQVPERPRRRALYLANTAWLCRKPSLEVLYPEEARIERRLSVEAHSETGVRQQELLSTPLRDALQCKSDFAAQRECGPLLTADPERGAPSAGAGTPALQGR